MTFKLTNMASSKQAKSVLAGRARPGRILVSTITALSLVAPNAAWAICSDGTNLPAGGYVLGAALPAGLVSNWSPGIFTGTVGSVFVPDTSTNEFNDPTKPSTGGGHNWVSDQGTTLCKVIDTGPAGPKPTGWAIPQNTPTIQPGSPACILTPTMVGGQVVNVVNDRGFIGDIPRQSDVLTPTCDPNLLAKSANTYFNQLGCSISHGIATTPQTATSYLFVAGKTGGLFSIPLNNVANPALGGDAGKTAGPQNYYSAIPEGQLLSNAAISKDGQFAIVTSRKNSGGGGGGGGGGRGGGGTVPLAPVWACLNPLGDPGDPSKPINPTFQVPAASTVRCMSVGSHSLQADLATAFGPDNQPYFGGQRVVNTFNATPGGHSRTAWPNCIWQNSGAKSLADAFAANRQNGCGNAVPNFGFQQAGVVQPSGLITRGSYMYASPVNLTVVQFKVTVDPVSGLSQYASRLYVSGLARITGLGSADDLASLMVFTDPSASEVLKQEVVIKLPVCEDMQ